MKLKNILLSTLFVASVSTSAVAGIYNPSSPVGTNASLSDLDALLEGIVDDGTGNTDIIDIVNDQTGAAIWSPTDLVSSTSFLINMVNVSGTLGVYSYATGEEVDLTFGPNNQSTISFTNGQLFINNGFSGTSADNTFGTRFGFYYKDGSSVYYSEDAKNNGESKVLSYLLDDGISLNKNGTDLGTTSGKDDWFIAFEGNTNNNDYMDAVFAIKDISVPAPATLALLGLGLVGIGAASRRRKKNDA